MTKKTDKRRLPAAEFCSQVEERGRAEVRSSDGFRFEEEAQRLVHELKIHQIELEMQNDELRLARDSAEVALAKYTDLYDFAPVGYFTLDHRGAINAVNFAGACLIGITERSRVVGRHFRQFVSVTDRPEFIKFIETVFTSRGKEVCELLLLNEGGPPHVVQIEAIASASRKECRLALIDISVRREAEKTLRESEELLCRLAEMALDGIIMVDDSGTVTFCNSAGESMFGCAASEITGSDFSRLFSQEPLVSSDKHSFACYKELKTGPSIGCTTEISAHRRDGTKFPLELSMSAMKLKGRWHAIGILRDVTGRKML